MEIAFWCSLAACVCFVVLYFNASQKLAVQSERARRVDSLESQIQSQVIENQKFQSKIAELSALVEYERKSSQEKIELLQQAEKQLADTFKTLSSDSLKETQKHFFDVAKQTFDSYSTNFQVHMQQKHVAISDLVKPLAESLKAVDGKIQELEKTRVGAYATVSEQIKQLAVSQGTLQSETAKLVKALRAPSARGQWGEMQLKRVVEMAGMLSYCDFTEQQTLEGENARFRPDLIVRLPNSRCIVVDAKSPLLSYLESLDIENEQEKLIKLKEHAKHLKKHLLELSEKAYWEKLSPTPEFVVLFLPGEAFFSAALEQDPTLIEYGVDRKVLIASPTTLIALLRSVAYGWKEQMIAEHAQAIFDLGKSLHERLRVMTEHLIRLKKSLDGSVDSYNKLVSSYETRVLPAARKFEEMAVSDKDSIPETSLVDKLSRSLEIV